MNKSMFRRTAVASVLALGLGAAAQAATITWSDFPAAVIPNPAGVATGTVFHNVTGEVRSQRADPWHGSHNGGGFYSAVTRGATLTFSTTTPTTSISFVWGSPDSHNLVQFLSGGTVIDTASVTTGTAAGAATITASGFFDQVVFTANGNSFEFANLEFIDPIPVPAAGLMLMSALGGMAFLRRRQKNKA